MMSDLVASRNSKTQNFVKAVLEESLVELEQHVEQAVFRCRRDEVLHPDRCLRSGLRRMSTFHCNYFESGLQAFGGCPGQRLGTTDYWMNLLAA